MARPRKREPGVFGPRKLANGRLVWDVRYRDEQGRNRSRTFYELDGEDGANAWVVKRRHGLLNEESDGEMTLGEFFGRRQVRTTIKREHRLSEKTAKSWMEMWRNHLCHEKYGLSGKTLVQLQKKGAIDSFINGMDAAGVGEPMQRRVLGILSSILDQAVDDEAILRNPIHRMKKKPSAARQREIYIPSIEVIEMIRFQLRQHPNKRRRVDYGQRDALIVSLLAYHAPRPEELRMLTWRHSGLESGWLHIYAPKAARGKATVIERDAPLNDVVVKELESWRSELGDPASHSPIIPLPEWGKRRGGDHWSGENWKDWRERIFRPALRRTADHVATTPKEHAAICAMRPYDLRHTALSLWLANGGKDEQGRWDGSPANPVEVAAWGGHETTTLLRHYGHLVKSAPKVPIADQIRAARKTLE